MLELRDPDPQRPVEDGGRPLAAGVGDFVRGGGWALVPVLLLVLGGVAMNATGATVRGSRPRRRILVTACSGAAVLVVGTTTMSMAQQSAPTTTPIDSLPNPARMFTSGDPQIMAPVASGDDDPRRDAATQDKGRPVHRPLPREDEHPRDLGLRDDRRARLRRQSQAGHQDPPPGAYRAPAGAAPRLPACGRAHRPAPVRACAWRSAAEAARWRRCTTAARLIRSGSARAGSLPARSLVYASSNGRLGAAMRSELALFGPEATRRFLGALYRSAPARSFVEVRFRMASGMGQCFHRAAAPDRAAETILALASRTDVFVGVLPRARRGGGRRDLVARAAVVWADCDTWAAVEVLASFRPRPAMVVGSGSGENRHAYWFLREPVGVDRLVRANRRLALALGADAQSSDAARILRPAGSANGKHSPPAPVRMLALDEHSRVGLAELERRLPREPMPLSTIRPTRPYPHGAPIDPLRSIPPALYVERLTAQRGRPLAQGPLPVPRRSDPEPARL